jgi:Ca-activated chloride channel family protein
MGKRGRSNRSFRAWRLRAPALPALCFFVFTAAHAQESATFRASSSELVVLPVVVTQSNGSFVSDLPADRFTVYDNGRPQQVSLFSTEDTPVSVALVVDDSGSMRGKIGQVVAGATVFARSSNPDDELFVVEFNDRVREPVVGGMMKASDPQALEAALLAMRPDGETALYDALMVALDRLEGSGHPRKVILLISDGGDNASRTRLDDVLARARRSNVTIYAIGLYAHGAPDTNPDVLQKLADTTGGERYLPASAGPLVSACSRIAREIRSGYTIGYVPPDRDGAFHRIRVMVQGPGATPLKVRTRPGYFAAGTKR